MPYSKFDIPVEFSDQLQHVPSKDERLDEDIVKAVTAYSPVTSEKNIWAFWDTGFENMPRWSQRNVVNWVRLCGPTWTVRVLNSIPGSPNYALNYADKEMLPDAYVKGTMDGPYVGQHSADILRGAVLFLHGGAWIDVSIMLFRDLDRICWDQLTDPESPSQVAVVLMYGLLIGNFFVACRKHDPFIKKWHDLFAYLWRDRNNCDGLIDHPLLAFAHTLSLDAGKKDPKDFSLDFKVDPKTLYQYIGQLMAWCRLCSVEDTGDGFNGVDYWQHHVLAIDALSEVCGAEAAIGFDGKGQKFLDLLSTPLAADPECSSYREAYDLTWRLLTNSSFQKIWHAKNLTVNLTLGCLLELPENEGKDCGPGTFAELLRYGSVHFEQKRKSINSFQPPRPSTIIKKGLFEP